jgi:hypothetical protein
MKPWYLLSCYVRKYPSRISGYLSATILWFHVHNPLIPIELIIPSVMILIGLGEFAQGIEDKKTMNAIYSDNPPAVPDKEIIDHICYNDTAYKVGKK